MSKLINIKFTIENPPHLRHVDDNVTVKHKGGLELVEFKTGWGPCGRWVAKIEHKIDTATLRIKQTSFSKDMTDGAARHVELVKSAMKAQATWRSSFKKGNPDEADRLLAIAKAAQAAMEAHVAFAKEDIKVEHFVYQLEDIRGRIKAVEDTSDQKPTQ